MSALAEETGALNLGQGFPDEDGPAEVVEAAVDALRAGHNQYAPLPGVAPLREAIAEHQLRHYGIALDPATQVQVTFGATEALAGAILGIVEPGDDVLALDPTYDAYAALVARAGGRLRPIVMRPPAWRVEREAIEAALTPATRVLILNTPHNPTGRVLDRSELELLAEVAREHDLIVITDEVYEHLVFDGRHIAAATLPGMGARTLTISSIGKSYGLTGWKTGWATGPAELVGRVRGVKQFLTFGGGTPFQHASAVALRLPDRLLHEAAATLAAKRDRLSGALSAGGFDVLHTSGTYFLSVDASEIPGVGDALELCLRLPHEAGVVAIPMSVFTADPDGPARSIVRLAFCKRDEVLDEAAERLVAWRAEQG
ncbi:MAG: aminotransferase class I/II-fold pyridoxal phosphate-dependent enzyme [Solirubrobacteraceae bacterium]|nr:aminotransferase class I/II-fold pyridoxal phosphate-dependent enzyme [Solirubrobacteraceae bacterium]